MTPVDLIMITQAVDEEDAVLGFTTGWINALAENLRKLSVLCLRAGKRDLRENVSLRVLGKGKVRRLWRLRKGLKADLRDMDVRAIFAHMCPRYAVAARKLVGRKVPVLLWYAHSAKSFWLARAHRVCRFVLTPTPESCPIRSEKVVAVGHGIDVQRFSAASREHVGRILLLSAGRIAPVKRCDFLMEAFAEAAKAFPTGRLSLRVLGSPSLRSEGAYLSRLRRIVAEKGLEGAVEFRPAVPYTQMEEEYADCDIFLSTAIRHSIDKAPLEAMACGKVLLTSNRNFRAVLGEYSDMLVADDFHSCDLARKIVMVGRMEPHERNRLGLALREIVVRDHSLTRLMGKVAAIIAASPGC